MMQATTLDDVFFAFARVASAFSTPSRLRLVDRLCQGEQHVEQLAEAAGLSVPNASRQLRLLADAGLLAARRDPPYVYYRLADESVTRFWFHLQALARAGLPEVDRIASDVMRGLDPVEPVSQPELERRLAAGDVVLIDVRPEAEFRAGHIPGAISIPLEQIPAALPRLGRAAEVVAYCRGPYCVLAAEAVRDLRAAGLRARRLADGFPEWRAAGRATEVAA